ncbi:hypothetical protein QN399_09895 [Pseudomonas sp. 10C3]|nr:hypothetical protein [Pseudomonas sp. 10C3]
MKRTAIFILVISGSLLLGGCWPYWEDGGGRGRDHDRGHDHERGDDRGYDHDRGRDRDGGDQDYRR